MTRGHVADFNGAPVPRKVRAHTRAAVPADVRALVAARHRAAADVETGLPSCYEYSTDRPCAACAEVFK